MTVHHDRTHFSRDASELLQRLNSHCANALEAAASLCQGRLADEISVEHWLLKLIEAGDGDIPAILTHYDLNTEAIWDALLSAIDHTPRTLRGRPSLSPQLAAVLREAWLHAATDATMDEPVIRSGNLLQAIVDAPHALRARNAWQLLSLSSAQIQRLLPRLGLRTCENVLDEPQTRQDQPAGTTTTHSASSGQIVTESNAAPKSKRSVEGDALARFAIDLT
jgi:type VI secretion system protein VasG